MSEQITLPSPSLHNLIPSLPPANSTGVYGGYPSTLGGGGGGGPGGSIDADTTETFLRGGALTDNAGIVELTTIYPGFYAGRTIHIHTMVHLGATLNENG